MSGFKWNKRRETAALWLAEGYTVDEAAEAAKITDRTIRRWKNNIEFMQEVDRLTFVVGISKRSERLRIAMSYIRQMVQDDGKFIVSKRDVLDWIKYAQSETDGAKLDIASLFENLEKSTESQSDGDQTNKETT